MKMLRVRLRGVPAAAMLAAAMLAQVLSTAVPAGAQTPPRRPDTQALAFDGVTVVDVDQGRLMADQVVVIIGKRIQAVGARGSVQLPAGAQVVDARGKYLIPGLWDMHVHVRDAPDLLYPLFIATGVTGVRELDQALGIDSLHKWRRQILAGERVGPRIIGTGPMIQTHDEDAGAIPVGTMSFVPRYLEVDTPEEGRRAVDSLKAMGADLVKIHSGALSREAYFAIAAEARRVGIPFVGHLPSAVTLAEASDSGQRSVEHFNNFPGPCQQADSDATAERECKTLAEQFLRNGTWFTPTLAVLNIDSSSYARDYLRYWPPIEETVTSGLAAYLGEEGLRGMVEHGQRLVATVHRFGMPLLAGTDIGRSSPVSIHQELALLAEAGLTPLEALRTATLNPAKYLGATDSLGTVAVGKLADLVLLDADPLAHIESMRRIRAVVANGRYYDRAALDALLAKLAEAARPGRGPQP